MRRSLPLFAATFALVAGAVLAIARPADPIRATAPRVAQVFPGSAPAANAPFGDAPAGACATRIESVADALVTHLERRECEPLPTPHSTDVGEIAVLEDDGTFFFLTESVRTIMDGVSVANAFFRAHGDDYDALAVYLSSGMPDWLGSTGALATCDVVRNDVTGIGLNTFDFGGAFGSPSRLHTFFNMNALSRYPANPDASIGGPGDSFSTLDVLAHEFGHRWLAYVMVDSAGQPSPALLGRDWEHWSFFADVDSSFMEGCDWISPAPDSFRTDGVSSAFGMLDMYLMGLRSKAETDSFFVVNDPTDFDPPGTYVPRSNPIVGLGCRGRATWWHVSDIEGANGPRVPDAVGSPHTFRVAFALIVPRGTDPTAADLAKLDTIRTRFPNTIAGSTEGRAAVDVTLDSHAGRVHIAHQPLPDTEEAGVSRPVGAQAWIEQAGIPIALDPSSVRAWWRLAGAGAYTSVPLANVAADSFAGALPGMPDGTQIEYYLSASSDSSGIDATLPAAGAAAPFTYFTGPDTIPPAVIHVPLPVAPDDQLPKTVLARVRDNLGVDSVWVEFAVNGGPPDSMATTPAGQDSFAAALGAGVPVGGRVAYRFVARDRALAHNLTYSNSAFDTFTVGRDWQEEFENGGAGWSSYIKTDSFRNPWHLAQDQSFPAGGTCWKAGACDTGLYAPHLDAVLAARGIYPVVPGTLVRFEHRYDLEQADATRAFDGVRIELLADSTHWDPIATAAGYTHTAVGSPLGAGTPCWSGKSNGWKSEIIDLTPYAGQSVSLRFHMGADDFVGGHGWYIDHVRVTFPTGPISDAGSGTARLAIGAPWPNPAHERLRVSLALPRAAEVDWSLFDLAGRRVASLAHGRREAGVGTLEAALPGHLASGVYFARLSIAGFRESVARVALVR